MNHDMQINRSQSVNLSPNMASVLQHCAKTLLVYGQPAVGGQPGCRLMLLPPESQQHHYHGQICLNQRPGREAAELEFVLCNQHGDVLEIGPVTAGGSLQFPWRPELTGQTCTLRLQPAGAHRHPGQPPSYRRSARTPDTTKQTHANASSPAGPIQINAGNIVIRLPACAVPWHLLCLVALHPTTHRIMQRTLALAKPVATTLSTEHQPLVQATVDLSGLVPQGNPNGVHIDAWAITPNPESFLPADQYEICDDLLQQFATTSTEANSAIHALQTARKRQLNATGAVPRQQQPTDNTTVRTFTNSLGMRLQLLPPAHFQMGTNSAFIPTNFWMSPALVTRLQWQRLMLGPTSWHIPSNQLSDQQPATCVNWYEATRFCEWLTRLEGRLYRLPTELEWEYACHVASTLQTSRHGKNTAAAVSPEPLLMLGSTWEWCSDGIPQPDTVHSGIEEPQTAVSLPRVVRGGSWYNVADNVRSALPRFLPPDTSSPQIGFRICCTAESAFAPAGSSTDV